ncbi:MULTISPECIES: nitrilase-related carbon-nitrogen hydrolase [unclassified Frankia]
MAAPVRAAALQLGCPDEENAADRVRRVLGEIRRTQADLVVLPELWVTGYFHFDRYEAEAEAVTGPTVTALREAARERGCHLVAGSIVERSADGRLFNTTVLIGPDGMIRHAYRKVHLFGYGSAEARLLTPGATVGTVPTELGVVGLATCYDLRFPELFRLLAEGGAEIVVVVSAWPLARLDHWRMLTRARAIENQVYLVACNAAGRQAGREMAGASVVVDPWGEVLAEAGPRPTTVRAELDPARPAAVRAEFPVLTHRRLGLDHQNRLDPAYPLDLAGRGEAFLDFWRERHLCSLTTVRPEGSPHVVAVGATLDPAAGIARVITSARSRKARLIAAGPAQGTPVGLCQIDGRRWSTLEGLAVLRDDPVSVADAEFRYAQRYRTPRANPRRVVVEVRITRVLGSV